MSTALKRFFCCFAPPNNVQTPRETPISRSGSRIHPFQNASTFAWTEVSTLAPKKLAKINSMYGTDDLIVSEFRSPNFKELRYNCPICFCYYNKILETSCCSNYICHGCSDGLNHRVLIDTRINVVACPFCANEEFTISDVDPKQKVKHYTDTPMRSTPRENGFGNFKDLLDQKFSRFSNKKQEKEESQIIDIGFASDGFAEFRNSKEKPSRPLTSETPMKTSVVLHQFTPKKKNKVHPTPKEESTIANQNETVLVSENSNIIPSALPAIQV